MKRARPAYCRMFAPSNARRFDDLSFPSCRACGDIQPNLRYLAAVPKTVIVSDETIRQLLEAHASMAAWYYQMAEALRDAGVGVHPPSDARRKAYIQQLATHYPELSAVAQSIDMPRPYVPPPVVDAPAQVKENEGIEVKPPPENHLETPAMIRSEAPAESPPPVETPSASPPATSEVPPPPAIVDPNKVKYE